MRLPRRLLILLVPLALLGAGCQAGRPRGTITFAVLTNILVSQASANGRPEALCDSAPDRLARAIEDLNAQDDIRFVVLDGNLIGDGRSRSLDHAAAALGELAKPYFVVLGPEGLAGNRQPEGSAAAPPETVGRSFLIWALRDHGFQGPQPYWSTDVGDGVTLVALDTAQRGVGKMGHLDAAQLQWLDETLATHAQQAVIVLAYHALVPLHAFDDTYFWQNHLVENRREVLDVLARHRNVLMVLSASHGFAAGKVVGSVVHCTVPALSVWPLAYDRVRITPQRIECQYVPVGTDDEAREAFDRLAADRTVRALFGGSPESEDQVVRVFGGRKILTWNLATLGP